MSSYCKACHSVNLISEQGHPHTTGSVLFMRLASFPGPFGNFSSGPGSKASMGCVTICLLVSDSATDLNKLPGV